MVNVYFVIDLAFMFILLRILVIPKHLPLTINKYNNTAVSAASKAQINITKSKILLSKWMFPASMKKRFKPIVVID